MILNSYAKLNLYLAVLNKRKDGYHNIDTLFERISLSDTIILKSLPSKAIRVISDSAAIPRDSSNLAWRAAGLLQSRFGLDKGVQIKIIKRIPPGAGLGGGSSNAACVLMGLNKLWRLALSRRQLVGLAQEIGSDVAFFIYNAPFARAGSRGDKVEPLRSLAKVRIWQVIVVPRISVSTPFIYKKWDKIGKTFRLTRTGYDVNITISALKKGDLSSVGRGLYNSLEPVASSIYPQITRIREKFIALGCRAVLMSGSGSAVFALAPSGKEALSLYKQLKAGRYPGQVFLARTA